MLKKIDAWRVKLMSDPIFIMLLLVPLYKPVGLIALFQVADWILIGWKAVTLLVVAAFFLAHPRVSLVTVLLGVYQVMMLVCTLLFHGPFMDWAYAASGVAGICLLLEQGLDTDPKALFKSICWLLGGMALINLATVLLFPGGMGSEPYCYFLGLDNGQAPILIPLMGMAAIYANSRHWPYLIQLGLVALFAASMYITWSATAMIGATAFIVLFLLYKVRGSYRLCNIYVYYAAIAVIFLAVIVFRVQERLSFIIVDVLHKDVTLSSRMPLWERVLAQIAERPLLGHGVAINGRMRELVGQSHCHNVILQTIFETGFVGLAVYLAALGAVGVRLFKRKDHYVGYILSAAFFGVLFDLMAEVPVYPSVYYSMFVLCYRVDDLIRVLDPEALPPKAA